MQTQPIQGYWGTKKVCEHLDISSRTISRYRLRSKGENPFPDPCFHGAGTTNKWKIADVKAWEDREIERVTQQAA